MLPRIGRGGKLAYEIVRQTEVIIHFRFLRRQFVCSCDKLTLRIVDAGICLVDHHTGEKGDTRFTLESLVPVIRLAHETGKLVVTRHAADEDPDDFDD